jgi:hypothetical protein
MRDKGPTTRGAQNSNPEECQELCCKAGKARKLQGGLQCALEDRQEQRLSRSIKNS